MATRREIIKYLGTAPLILSSLPKLLGATESLTQASETQSILRKIPSSGKMLPAVGMGSYQTFNITHESEKNTELFQVLTSFFNAGGQLVDSSPMYGQSEIVLGKLISKIEPKPQLFAASKVWTYGQQMGEQSIEETRKRMQVETMDLMQVHNLRDWKVQLETLNLLKQQNKLHYTGITTSFLGQYEEFEAVMQSEKLDFVQLNYNIKVREAEKRLLPLAQDKGMGVIVNMPFEKGGLFKFVRSAPLPDWASEIDCKTWGQFFLKFIISHPAVTCVIPATSKVAHMRDNMQAMQGRLPDAKMRQEMLTYFDSL